jgi:hypothetical protein
MLNAAVYLTCSPPDAQLAAPAFIGEALLDSSIAANAEFFAQRVAKQLQELSPDMDDEMLKKYGLSLTQVQVHSLKSQRLLFPRCFFPFHFQ